MQKVWEVLTLCFALVFILKVKFTSGETSEIPGIIRGLAMEEQNTCVISETSLFKDLLIACIYKNQASKI